MKILFIGGTGTISSAISKSLLKSGHELYLLNRGNKNDEFCGAKFITADIHNESDVASKISGHHFDVVADFIAFTTDDVKRDYRLFCGKCDQYIFISSASAYEKPLKSHIITEKTPLVNPFWSYSQNKADCEDYLFERYRIDKFPVTVVRPSHTYSERSIPTALHGNKGAYSVIKRIINEQPVIIPGDGESLWTLTFNTDFAPLFIAIMGQSTAIGEAFQITSDESLTWTEIYHTIAAAYGKKLNPLYMTSKNIVEFGRKFGYDFEGGLLGDKSNSVIFDNSKVKAYLPDYETKTPFSKGVAKCVEYISAHSECQIEDEEFDRFCDEAAKAYM